MHVCCIGKCNIPVFTRKIHFPFDSNKEKSEGKKKPPHIGAAQLKSRRLVEKSFPCVDGDINGVCGLFCLLCVFVYVVFTSLCESVCVVAQL